METNDKKRIEDLLSELKHTKYSLSIALGYANGSVLNNIHNGRNGISAGLARKITNKYPEINYEWILTGKGTMLVKPKETPVDETILKQMKLLERLSEGQDAQIQLLKDRVKLLEQRFEPEKNLITT